MKIVVIGTNHAGIATANTLIDQYPGHEIVMIDRNSNMSYLGCGTAIWVGRQIEKPDELFYAKAEDFEKKGVKILQMVRFISMVNVFKHLIMLLQIQIKLKIV